MNYDELLLKNGSASIHHRNIQNLATEMLSYFMTEVLVI